MDDELRQRDDELLARQGELPPILPADSLSAARSCQAILIMLLFLLLLLCVAGGLILTH